MTAFYRFARSYEAIIYIALALGGLFAFRWLWQSWRERRTAVYRMEREFAAQRFMQSAALAALITVLFCAEFFLATFFLPGLPASTFSVTLTPDFLSTPTGTLSPEMMTQFAAQPSGALIPQTVGCAPSQIEITSPQSGDDVRGVVELIGSANIPNFGFYKLDTALQGGSNWAIFSAGSAPVKNGSLGKWDATPLTPGDYQLRLTVSDNQGQSLPSCVISVRVAPPQ